MFMFQKRNLTPVLLALSLALFAAGCKKRAPVPAPPPPAPPVDTSTNRPNTTTPPAPVVASFSAEPTTIQRGQSSTLRWEVTGASTTVTIDNAIGTVQNTGNRRVFPNESTTYTLTAQGPGGSTTSSVTVSVTSAPPPPPPPPPGGGAGGTIESRVGRLQDAYFEYDKSDISAEAGAVLSSDAAAIKSILTDFPNATIVVEGHC